MIRIKNNILNPFALPFYLVQFALWISYGIIYRLIWLGYDYYVPPDAIWYIVYISGGYISTTILAIIYWKNKNRIFYIQFALSIIASVLIAVIWRFCFNYIDFHFIDSRPPANLHFFRYIIGGMSSVIQLLAWSIGYLLIAYYIKYKDQQNRAIKAELQARDAQIKQLYQQISPHFLYNVLNSLDTLLIKKDTDNAREMVAKLSDYLKKSLKDINQFSCTLEEEINNAKSYLEIEKIRFGDKLTINFDCDDKANDILVPRLILQPLIENAIKHSINNSLHGGQIIISTLLDPDFLQITITNDSKGTFPSENSIMENLGIGLKNIASRLDVFYSGNAKLDFKEISPEKYQVTIIINRFVKS